MVYFHAEQTFLYYSCAIPPNIHGYIYQNIKQSQHHQIFRKRFHYLDIQQKLQLTMDHNLSQVSLKHTNQHTT